MHDYIVCQHCNKQTSRPPYDDWEGYCPSCLIKDQVLPFIPDPRVRDLLEGALRDMIAQDDVEVHVIPLSALVGDNDDNPALDVIGTVMRGLQSVLRDSAEAREAMKNIIDKLGEQDQDEKVGGRADRPIVRNDPRTG